MPLAQSVLLMEIMDEIRKQVGVAFSQDSQWHHSKAGLRRWSQTCSDGAGADAEGRRRMFAAPAAFK